MSDKVYINNADLETWGVFLANNAYSVLRTPAKLKEGVTNSWAEDNGTERDVTDRKFESRALILSVVIQGANEADYTIKYDAFFEMLATVGYFDLKVERLNRVYRLLYLGVQNYKDYYTHAAMDLQVVDDFPHQITKIK